MKYLLILFLILFTTNVISIGEPENIETDSGLEWIKINWTEVTDSNFIYIPGYNTTNCSIPGTCSEVAYMDYSNIGNFYADNILYNNGDSATGDYDITGDLIVNSDGDGNYVAIFDTATDTEPVSITRLGNPSERLDMSIDDLNFYMRYYQDEDGDNNHKIIFDNKANGNGDNSFVFSVNGTWQFLIDDNGSLRDASGSLTVDDSFQVNSNSVLYGTLDTRSNIFSSTGRTTINDNALIETDLYVGGTSDGLFIDGDGKISDVDDPLTINDHLFSNDNTPFYSIGKFQYIMHPEDGFTNVIPYFMNDLAYLLYKGGTVDFIIDGVNTSYSDTQKGYMFDGKATSWSYNPATKPVISVVIGFDANYKWGKTLGWSSFGGFRGKNFTLEKLYSDGTWSLVSTETNYPYGQYSHQTDCSSLGCTGMRVNFTDYASSSIFRISQMYLINYDSPMGTDYFASLVNPEFLNDVTINNDLDIQGSIYSTMGEVIIDDFMTVNDNINVLGSSYLGDTDDGLRIDSSGIIVDQDDNVIINDNLTVGAGTNYNVFNKLNLVVGSNSDSDTNGISFIETNTPFHMKLGYDGTGSGTENKLSFYTNDDTSIMVFENGGNVGIGVFDPSSLFEVGGDAVIYDNIITNTSSTALVFGGFYSYDETDGGINITLPSADTYYNITDVFIDPVQSNNGTIFTQNSTTGYTNFHTNSDGYYQINLQASFMASRTGEYHCSVWVNDVETIIGFERTIGITNEVGNAGETGFLELQDGDMLNLRCETSSGANPDLFINHLAFNFKKMII